MSLRVDLLRVGDEEAYEQMLLASEHSLLYASLAYRNFLRSVLTNSQDLYLAAFEGSRLVGALPAFITRGQYGPVLNSLPFYGSHGGFIVSPEIRAPRAIKQALLEAYHAVARKEGVVTSTIVSSPLDLDQEFYETQVKHTLRDERVGQLTPLPPQGTCPSELADGLMTMFHKKTRNSIRKAQKSGFNISHSGYYEALRRLAALHSENITAIGGLDKPWSVFEAIRENFVYDRDYRVYVAEKEGQIVAALLVFFYNRTAEYFIPATSQEFRPLQPMSLLVFEAMQEAARRGCSFWNWGGTWLSQGGVYRFKSRWGTQDMPYYYYTREYVLPSPL